MKPNICFFVVDEKNVIVTTAELPEEAFYRSHFGKPGVFQVLDLLPYTPGDKFENGTHIPIKNGTAIVHNHNKVIGLPVPCEIQIDTDDWIAVTDGEFELDADYSGTYMIGIRSETTYYQRLFLVIS